MNRLHSNLALLLLTTAAGLAGCDTSDDAGMVGGRAYPPAGSYVYVQFRRDYLGLAGDKATTPMGETGMTLASSGTMKRIGDEFLVLSVDNEPNREIWIPRDAILLLDVRRTK